ncbi:proteinase-activated receptor 1-like [Hyperolius riggenbachi]|uniref:proteinase-activated receptor 1-like n=1 Tax=Hyperolius riggenbachi TaxID=752182 RepID=UPI0035A32319
MPCNAGGCTAGTLNLMLDVLVNQVDNGNESFQNASHFCSENTSDVIQNTTCGVTHHPHFLETFHNSWWLSAFVPCMYSVVFFVALPLNTMAIIVFLVKVKVKKPAVVYMVNLAAADVLFVSILPFKIVYEFCGYNWLLGEGMCRFITAAYYFNMFCSVLLMASISVDRFLAVVYPMLSLSWRTVKRAWLACFVIWAISIASTMPVFLTIETRRISNLNITTCHDELIAQKLNKRHANYFITIISLFFFVPLIVTFFCYVGAIRTIKASNVDGTKERSRAIVLTVVVLCVFLFCFGPANGLFLSQFVHYVDSLYFSYNLCVCIGSISCCLDPLLYYFASSRFQGYLYSLLCCK